MTAGAIAVTTALAGLGGGTLALLARGALTLELGIGRRVRSLGPLSVEIAAPRNVVFDVVAAPYLGRAPRALESKLNVIEPGTDMVLAAHFTPLSRFVEKFVLHETDVRERVVAARYDVCPVVNEHRVVLGLLRGGALSKDPEGRTGEVMELGPKTLRPSNPVEKLLESRANQGVKHWVVTTSHGKLLGLLFRTDAEAALQRA